MSESLHSALYTYVWSNPLRYVDNEGRTPVEYPPPKRPPSSPSPQGPPHTVEFRKCPFKNLGADPSLCRDTSWPFLHTGKCYRQPWAGINGGQHICVEKDGSCNVHYDLVCPCIGRDPHTGECLGCFTGAAGAHGVVDVIPAIIRKMRECCGGGGL